MNSSYDTIILGAGLSGLTVAHTIRHRLPQHRILVLERSDRSGGVIETHSSQGFISEKGPHGFLDNCLESQELLRETGLDQERVTAPLSQHVRYVYLNGKLNCIPQSPPKILMAPLISWPAKLRVAAEVCQRPLAGEPSVAQWVKHRFGKSLLPFADAVFTGTYAGDCEKLAIDAVMPGVRALEQQHGSVIRGLIAKLRAAGKKEKRGMPAMTSFPEGMERLTKRLTELVCNSADLLLDCPAEAIARTDSGWKVISRQGEYTASHLVVALPVNASLKILATFTADMPCSAIPEAWIANVVFGFPAPATLPPGFGFLIPEQENQFILGSLFSSNMFSGRAPQGMLLCETLVGGRRHPERRSLDSAVLIEQARENVQRILQIKEQPVYTEILQPSGGIPQLEQGYVALLNWRNRLVHDLPNLHVCGFGWDGIGINDMIKTARRVADTLCRNQTPGQYDHEVKKIYF